MTTYPAIKVKFLKEILANQAQDLWVVPRPQGILVCDDDGRPESFIEIKQTLHLSGTQDPAYPTETEAVRHRALFEAAEEVAESYETISTTGDDEDFDAAIGALRLAMLPLYGEDAECSIVGDRLTMLTHRERRRLEAIAEAAQTIVSIPAIALLIEGRREAPGMVSVYISDSIDRTTLLSVEERRKVRHLFDTLAHQEEV